MSYEGVKFAEKGIAGHISDNIKSGIKSFAELNFQKIYHYSYYDKEVDADIKRYRQSAVIRAGGFPLFSLLDGIVCSSMAEKKTLLYMIKDVVSPENYNVLVNRTKCLPDYKCFYNSGIYIREVGLQDNKLRFEFNDPDGRGGGNNNTVLSADITIKDYNTKQESTAIVEVNYKNAHGLLYYLPLKFEGNVCVRFDNCLMYCNDINTNNELV